MRWLVLLAACVPPAAPQHPAGLEVSTCHLAPLQRGALSWVSSHGTELDCTASVVGEPRDVCFLPVVGVRQTGAVYAPHDVVCTDSDAVTVTIDMPRALCQLDRGGCIVHSFAVDWPKPLDSGAVVTLARSLEAHAAQPGRDRPTVAECDALADRWEIAARDEMIATCIEQSRATLACLQASADLNAARSCVP